MDKTPRSVPIIIGYLLVGLLISVVLVLRLPVPGLLIQPFVFPFKLFQGFLNFIDLVPALIISGILLAYTLYFGKASEESHARGSPHFLRYLKGAFFVLIVCIAVYVVLEEGFAPWLESSRVQHVASSEDYHDFLEMSSAAELRGDHDEAERYLQGALRIWKKSPEAKRLLEAVRYSRADSLDKKNVSVLTKKNSKEEPVAPGASSLDVLTILNRATEALNAQDFFTAHYYAMQAWSLAANRDPNKAAAMELAAQAWNEIGEGSARFVDYEERELYSGKVAGYSALQGEDPLRAYYIFADIKDHIYKIDGRIDTDVDRFLEISREALTQTHFFIDETENLRLFESSRDLFFVIRHPDGSADCFFGQGITYSRSSGRDLAFIRSLELIRLNKDFTLRFHIEVPYAKMFAIRGTDGKNRPQILLRAVDRNKANSTIVPIVHAGNPSEEDLAIQVLDMPYTDFALVVAANRGILSMQMLDIIRLLPKVKTYGFSGKLLMAELINRLSEPFLIMILSVFALIVAWRYRLSGHSLFKAWWAVAVPLFPLACIQGVNVIRYLAHFVIVLTVEFFPAHPAEVVLGFLFVSLFLVSALFFVQRTE